MVCAVGTTYHVVAYGAYGVHCVVCSVCTRWTVGTVMHAMQRDLCGAHVLLYVYNVEQEVFPPNRSSPSNATMPLRSGSCANC